MADHRTTDVPYAGMSQTDIREPVLRGVGHAPLGPAADSYRAVAEQLRGVGDRVADALRTAATAHAGDAADAAARHIDTGDKDCTIYIGIADDQLIWATAGFPFGDRPVPACPVARQMGSYMIANLPPLR